MLGNQLRLLWIAVFAYGCQSNFADLTGRDPARVHRIQQNRRPIAATGQDSLGGQLQMAGQPRVRRDDTRCNFRVAEVLQASQQLSTKTFWGPYPANPETPARRRSPAGRQERLAEASFDLFGQGRIPEHRKAAGVASLIFSRKARLMRAAFVG